jgi:hypothetical protein
MLEARWLMATVQLNLGNGERAEKEITRATELGLAPQAAQPILVKAMALQSKWDQVLVVHPVSPSL